VSAWQLTELEVREITGAVHRRKQLEWFAANGVPAALGGDNKVKVLREAYERRMLPPEGRGQRRHAGPNLDALKKAS
jgi:hypothetical protein